MATVSTIDNLRLDTNKKVFIVGKGGSSVNAINLDRSNGYTVCINSSCVLFEEVDFLFMNDHITIENILKHNYELSKVKNIVCPIQLHHKEVVSKYTVFDLKTKLKDFDINLYTFKLHTQKIKSPPNIDNMEFNCLSSAEAALHWFTRIGFRSFEIFGMSSGGEYNDQFTNKNDRGSRRRLKWYKSNIQRCKKILKDTNSEYAFN